MSKPLYEDVRKKCTQCNGEIPSSRSITNFCSETCWFAYRMKNPDKMLRGYRKRQGSPEMDRRR